jgi:ATP-dependent Clp protease ATP-binding subunit ClpA
MFERFTPRARQVVVLAQEESRRLGHNYIGTEHVLLGVLREADGLGAKVLVEMGVSLDAVRQEVEAKIGPGGATPSGHIPFTPRAKKSLELALREALQLGHNYIGTEHVLLGLLREGEGMAAEVLCLMGVGLDAARAKVIESLAGFKPPPLTRRKMRRRQVRQAIEAWEHPAAASPNPERNERVLHEITAVLQENDRLHAEIARLRNLLHEHGIDPEPEAGDRSA